MDIQESEMPPLKLQESHQILNPTFAEVSGRVTIPSQLMHISIMLAITKTSAINPKELARIQQTEHEDALCDEG
jgi:hypothetical protein